MMINSSHTFSLVLLSAVMSIQPAYSKAWAKNKIPIFGEQSGSADDLKIELNAPTVPAGAILGDEGLELSSVRTSSDFFTQILTGIGDKGTLQPGLAIGGAPYWWFGPKETLDQYQNSKDNYPLFLLKRTQLGIATKSISGDDDEGSATGLGVSLSWQLNPEHDVRMSDKGLKCMNNTLLSVQIRRLEELQAGDQSAMERFIKDVLTDTQRETIRNGGDWKKFISLHQEEWNRISDEELRRIEEERATTYDNTDLNKARRSCASDFTNYLKEKDSVILTIASAFQSKTGNFSNLKEDHSALWLTYKSGSDGFLGSLPIPVQAFAGYEFDAEINLGDDIKERVDKLTLGIGASRETDDSSIDVQASYVRSDFETMRDTSEDLRITLAYSHRLQEAIWVELKAGFTRSDVIKSDEFFGVNLKVDTAAILGN